MVAFHLHGVEPGAHGVERSLTFSVSAGAALLAGSRHGVVPTHTASLVVAALRRLGFSFLVGCAPGVDACFRRTLALSPGAEERTFVACAFAHRAEAISKTGLFASLVVPGGVSPKAALRRRTLWMVKRSELLLLFPDDPATGRWGRGSALAFRAALDQLKPVFVVTSRAPARSLSYHVVADRFCGFLPGFWAVPHPVEAGTCDEEL